MLAKCLQKYLIVTSVIPAASSRRLKEVNTQCYNSFSSLLEE